MFGIFGVNEITDFSAELNNAPFHCGAIFKSSLLSSPWV
jgi:hypothetical protein